MDVLYDDALMQIALYLDYQSLKILHQISKRFHDFCDHSNLLYILRKKLSNSKLSICNYNLRELYHILRIDLEYKNISVGSSHGLILTNNGTVYVLGFMPGMQKCHVSTIISELKNVIQIEAGHSHSLALINTGEVYAFGLNISERLWLDKNTYANPYTKYNLLELSHIISISVGDYHSLLLTAIGQVYSCGHNFNGQLGFDESCSYIYYTPHGDNNLRLIPQLNNIIEISAGANHSLALVSNGQVYAFGSNSHGQLGINDADTRLNLPKLISDISDIIQISAGNYHSLMLTDQNRVYTCGYNINGQLGLGDNIDRYTPVVIPTLENVISISAGNDYSLVLLNTGYVYSFGCNDKWQLGLDTELNYDVNIPTIISKLNDIVQISAGRDSSFAVSDNGTIYAFGDNNWGSKID